METSNPNQDPDNNSRQLTVVSPQRPPSWGGERPIIASPTTTDHNNIIPHQSMPPPPPPPPSPSMHNNHHQFNSGQFLPMMVTPPPPPMNYDHHHILQQPSLPSYYYPPTPYGSPMMLPPPHRPQQIMYSNFRREWSTGLFSCFTTFNNVKNSSLTLLFPCIAFGQIAEIVNEGETMWYEPATLLLITMLLGSGSFLPCMYTGLYRMKIRNKYHLKGTIIEDCIIHCLCPYCGVCQQYRELEYQGFHVHLGWARNREIQRQAMGMYQQFVPPMIQEMSR